MKRKTFKNLNSSVLSEKKKSEVLEWVSKNGLKDCRKFRNTFPNLDFNFIKFKNYNVWNPQLSKGNFTVCDDFEIFKFFIEFNGSWKKIAEKMPHRCRISIRNRFVYSSKSKKIENAKHNIFDFIFNSYVGDLSIFFRFFKLKNKFVFNNFFCIVLDFKVLDELKIFFQKSTILFQLIINYLLNTEKNERKFIKIKELLFKNFLENEKKHDPRNYEKYLKMKKYIEHQIVKVLKLNKKITLEAQECLSLIINFELLKNFNSKSSDTKLLDKRRESHPNQMKKSIHSNIILLKPKKKRIIRINLGISF